VVEVGSWREEGREGGKEGREEGSCKDVKAKLLSLFLMKGWRSSWIHA